MTQPETLLSLLEGSCVVISGDIDGVTGIIPHSRGLITPLITTHEPPSVKAQTSTLQTPPTAPRNVSFQAQLRLPREEGMCLGSMFRVERFKGLRV